jgi:hypothetical protein
MNIVPPFPDLAAEWTEACLLYPIYAALAKEFVIDIAACVDLETGADAPPQESVEQARQWLDELDGRIQVHQLRRFLQTTSLATQESLQTLLLHHLRKEKKSDSDRDKVDFVLVQYFSHCAPSQLQESDVDLEYVAQVLEPVLGQVDLTVPEWLKPLDQTMQAAQHCRDLSELLHSGILEQGRKAKVQCGDNYFQPVAMIAFARFSFLMRRATGKPWREDPRLPPRPVLRRRAHRPPAHDLPVLESDVPRGVFLGTAPAHAGGSQSFDCRGAGVRHAGRNPRRS